jgi:uncharacterized membrane protein YkvA (DUF1232 family)
MTPLWAKGTVAAALTYVLSTVDVIPDAIPVAGWADDSAVVFAAFRAVRAYLKPLHWQQAGAWLRSENIPLTPAMRAQGPSGQTELPAQGYHAQGAPKALTERASKWSRDDWRNALAAYSSEEDADYYLNAYPPNEWRAIYDWLRSEWEAARYNPEADTGPHYADTMSGGVTYLGG